MVCSNQPTEDGRSPQAGRATLASHQAPAGLGHAEGIPNAGEDFLHQLRRVNTDRYDAWAERPIMLCEHCGADEWAATEQCAPPFARQAHQFSREHPYLTTKDDAGIMFDAVELGGEVGELLNVVKKLEREDRGWRGSRAGPDDFADECADVLICLDKLARRRGVDLVAATIRKFNATSDKVGLPHKLAAQVDGNPKGGDAKQAPGDSLTARSRSDAPNPNQEQSQ